MEARPRMDLSRPSAVRLWGFVLSVGGAFIAVIGALRPWVTIQGQITSSRGVDDSFGIVILVAAGVVLVCTIGIRLAGARVPLAIVALLASIAIVVAAVLAWRLLPGRVEQDERDQAVAAGQAMGLPQEVLDALGDQVITVDLGSGVAIAALGGAIAVVGGVLTLRWAHRISGDPSAVADRPEAT